MMRRRAKRIREGQARERKKEGDPAHFGAHVNRTMFREVSETLSRVLKADLSIHSRDPSCRS